VGVPHKNAHNTTGLTEKTKTTTKSAEKYLENMGVPKNNAHNTTGLTEKTKTTTKSAEKYLENTWDADERRAAQMTRNVIRNWHYADSQPTAPHKTAISQL